MDYVVGELYRINPADRGVLIRAPNVKDREILAKIGYAPLVETTPPEVPQDGSTLKTEYTYDFADDPQNPRRKVRTGVRAVYTVVPPPAKGPRHWSSLAVKRTLEAAGKWTAVKELLVSLDRYDDFVMADYIAEDDAAFAAARAQAVALYGEPAVAALLDQIPVEEGA